MRLNRTRSPDRTRAEFAATSRHRRCVREGYRVDRQISFDFGPHSSVRSGRYQRNADAKDRESTMSLHRLRTRLDRLERAIAVAENDPDPARTFIIDPAVARALRDDYERENYLSCKGGPLSAAEIEEKSRLLESIKERARAIGCPSSYGKVEQGIDCRWLNEVRLKRRPGWGGAPLTAAEDAEEAQARARYLSFRETPEGRAQIRIPELGFKYLMEECSAAETEELKDLCRRYPDSYSLVTYDPSTDKLVEKRRAKQGS